MYETPSLHKFGYSSEQLKLREYQELKDMIKSPRKISPNNTFQIERRFATRF